MRTHCWSNFSVIGVEEVIAHITGWGEADHWQYGQQERPFSYLEPDVHFKRIFSKYIFLSCSIQILYAAQRLPDSDA